MICGKDINLWALEKTDIAQNYYWGNDPELIKLTGMPPFPKSGREIEQWMDNIISNPFIQTYAIKQNDGTYIGNVELSNIDWISRKAEVGIMIGNNSSRNRGLGSQAILLLSRFAFEDMGLHRLYAKVLNYNHRAQKTFEKCGYTVEGKERESFFAWGHFWDVIIYGMLSSDFFDAHGRDPISPENMSCGSNTKKD